jgi:hypothetical protein
LLCILAVVLVVAVTVPPPFRSPPPPSILIAPAPVHLAVLGVDEGNNNHIPSLIILSRKSLVHLQISRSYLPLMRRGKGGGGCSDHCDRLDSLLTAAMTTTANRIVEDGRTTLVHSPGSGMIHPVYSPSLLAAAPAHPPTAANQRQ